MTKPVFSTLNGLRGVAAIAVVTLHDQHLLGHISARSGHLAVDLFFVLSGFVLAHAYEQKFANGLDPLEFGRLRLMRFYPLYAVGTLLGLISAIVAYKLGAGNMTGTQLAGTAAAALLMLPTPFLFAPLQLFPLNTPGWSLLLEWLVNVAYAVFAKRLTVVVLLGAIAVSALLFGVATLAFGTADLGSYWGSVPASFPRVTFSFFSGVLIYRFRSRQVIVTGWSWLMLAALVVPMFYAPGEHVALYELFVIFVVFPAIVLVGSRLQPSPRSRLFFEFLGYISFPLYAVHYPVFEFARRAVRASGLDVESVAPWTGMAVLLVLLPFCWALGRYFDDPIRKRLRRRRLPSPIR